MTADRKPLPDGIECWVPSEGMDSLNLYPDLAGPGSSTYVRTEDHLADRAKLLDRIEELELEVEITAREALDRIAELEAMVRTANERHAKEVRAIEKDLREEARDAVAEARWQERQGDDYGSY